MRISDCSSDVCSSDLAGGADAAHAFVQVRRLLVAGVVAGLSPRLALGHVIPPVTAAYLSPPPLRASLAMIPPAAKATPNAPIGRSRIRSAALSTRTRSEERRVGKEGGRTFRSRGGR